METYNEKHLLELAQNGDVEAMMKLGSYYYFPKHDLYAALHWYQKALDYGNNDALLWIARVHEQLDIQEFSKDRNISDYECSVTTIEWYEKAFDYFVSTHIDNIVELEYKKAFDSFVYASHLCNKEEIEKLWIQLNQRDMNYMED